MEFLFDLQSLKDPKKLLFLGILLLAIGAFLFVGLGFDGSCFIAVGGRTEGYAKTGKLRINNSNIPIDF